MLPAVEDDKGAIGAMGTKVWHAILRSSEFGARHALVETHEVATLNGKKVCEASHREARRNDPADWHFVIWISCVCPSLPTSSIVDEEIDATTAPMHLVGVQTEPAHPFLQAASKAAADSCVVCARLPSRNRRGEAVARIHVRCTRFRHAAWNRRGETGSRIWHQLLLVIALAGVWWW